MSPEILAACQQLLKSGKAITTGMLKSKLPTGTPLPEIIRAVQYCKQQPQAVAKLTPDTSVEESIPAESDAERIKQLEQRIEAIEKRMLMLEQKLLTKP